MTLTQINQSLFAQNASALRCDIALIEASGSTTWHPHENGLIASPYQRRIFTENFLKSIAGERDGQAFLLSVAGQDGKPLLLWPFLQEKRASWRIARPIGGAHANFNLPLFDAAGCAEVGAARLKAVLDQAFFEAGCDFIFIPHAPLAWLDEPNPFLCWQHQPSVNQARSAKLGADGPSSLKALRSKTSLRNLAAKKRKLSGLGALRFMRIAPGQESLKVLRSYRHLKDRWSQLRHISNEFAEDGVGRFYERMAVAGSLLLWAVELDDEIIAIAGGYLDNGHFSLAIIASEQERLAAHSPGDLVIEQVIGDLPGLGARTVDFGTGDVEYKRRWLPIDMPLADILSPVTFAGQVGVSLARAGLGVKAFVKSRADLAHLLHKARFALNRT